MTTPQSVLAAFAIILVDLFARAGLDKVLALIGSPETIALWAQLQSVVELVSAVTIVGVLTGLTVMIAQLHEPSDEPVLLRHALKLASRWLSGRTKNVSNRKLDLICTS